MEGNNDGGGLEPAVRGKGMEIWTSRMVDRGLRTGKQYQ